MTTYVSYCRVSSEEQSRSGLGLESQIQIINRYIKGEGGKLLHSFTEVCSGSDKRGIRPIFKEAVEFCHENNYTLIVSKIDPIGQIVYLEKLGKQAERWITIDASQFSQGMYFCKLTTNNSEYVRKVIKQ